MKSHLLINGAQALHLRCFSASYTVYGSAPLQCPLLDTLQNGALEKPFTVSSDPYQIQKLHPLFLSACFTKILKLVRVGKHFKILRFEKEGDPAGIEMFQRLGFLRGNSRIKSVFVYIEPLPMRVKDTFKHQP